MCRRQSEEREKKEGAKRNKKDKFIIRRCCLSGLRTILQTVDKAKMLAKLYRIDIDGFAF